MRKSEDIELVVEYLHITRGTFHYLFKFWDFVFPYLKLVELYTEYKCLEKKKEKEKRDGVDVPLYSY